MTDKIKLKKIPYGISDFKTFSDENFYYVDKSRFIRLIEEKGKFLFLIRPRRFGKSLFLSMMEYYYDILYKDKFDKIFDGTYIHEHPTEEKNKYMILKFNFSGITPGKEIRFSSFLNYTRKTAKTFIKKYNNYLDIDLKSAENDIDSQQSPSDVMIALLDYLANKEEKIYIIIDEYDNFANTILSDSGQDEYHSLTHGEGFFRAFFNVLKGGATGSDTPIARLFMTGVSPITLDDVTSGFNIATNISLHKDINEIMGFTGSEVETLIEYYRQIGKILHPTSEIIKIMEYWYNHYRFSTDAVSEVFNTVHILYFLQEYLSNSRIPYDLVDNNARIDYNKLRHLILIDKQGVKVTNGNFSKLQHILETNGAQTFIKKGFPADAIMETENFYSLLYYFGLLTINGTSPSGQALLTIPNEFVKHLFYDYIKETIKEAYSFHIDMNTFSNLFEEMAFKGNWQGLIEYISGRMEAALSLRDLMNSEKAHQVFWNAYLGLSSLYNIYSEKEMNQGYADLVMEPLLIQNPGIKYSYLMEIKYMKWADYEKLEKEGLRNKISMLCNEAKVQLNQYGKDERFIKNIGNTTLKKLILIFSGNRMVHHSEI